MAFCPPSKYTRPSRKKRIFVAGLPVRRNAPGVIAGEPGVESSFDYAIFFGIKPVICQAKCVLQPVRGQNRSDSQSSLAAAGSE